jgi:hypothetical protein
MCKLARFILFTLLLSVASLNAEAAGPEVIYWDSDDGKVLRARISADADYWQLIPWFAEQINQTYCGVASAITVLNAMPIKKPVDPIYAPHAYFTQRNFFTPEVVKIISPKTVLNQGMTRDEMVKTLARQGVKASSIAGDSIDESALRSLLQKTLGDDGQFVLVNFSRASLGQDGGGHWSVLAAYDSLSDRALILDVSKYMYAPEWVEISTLRKAIDTLDTTSNKARGLVFVSK